MVDPKETPNEDKSEGADDKINTEDLGDDLYDTMDSDDSSDDKNADDSDYGISDEDDKKPVDSDNADKGEDDKKPVEDDDLLGVEDSDDDDSKKAEDDKSKDDDDEGDDEKKDDDDDSKSKAPEDYKLQADENSLLGAEEIKKTAEYAAKHNMTQEQAEEHLKDKEAAVQEYQEFLDRTAESRAQETLKKSSSEWITESKTHFGDSFKEKVHEGNLFVKKCANENMKKMLKDGRFGNQKDFIDMCATAARHMKLSDDKLDLNAEDAVEDKALEDHIYDTM